MKGIDLPHKRETRPTASIVYANILDILCQERWRIGMMNGDSRLEKHFNLSARNALGGLLEITPAKTQKPPQWAQSAVLCTFKDPLNHFFAGKLLCDKTVCVI